MYIPNLSLMNFHFKSLSENLHERSMRKMSEDNKELNDSVKQKIELSSFAHKSLFCYEEFYSNIMIEGSEYLVISHR
jgi:hypothetical protein